MTHDNESERGLPEAERMARQFHEAYERLAPSFNYQTRPNTREFSPDSDNGRLMIAVCAELLPAIHEQGRLAGLEEAAKVCDHLTHAIDHAGNPYRRPADAERCATAIRALAAKDQP